MSLLQYTIVPINCSTYWVLSKYLCYILDPIFLVEERWKQNYHCVFQNPFFKKIKKFGNDNHKSSYQKLFIIKLHVSWTIFSISGHFLSQKIIDLWKLGKYQLLCLYKGSSIINNFWLVYITVCLPLVLLLKFSLMLTQGVL